LTSKAAGLFYVAYPVAVLALAFFTPTPARADFFDDARKTFTSDIPHFFQDDVPCFFGGQPTSGTRKSCKSPPAAANPASGQSQGAAPPPNTTATPPTNNATPNAPSNSSQ